MRWIVLVGCLAGCAGGQQKPSHGPWVLEIDSSYTVEDQQVVISAAQSWEKVVPAKFDVRIGCSGQGTCIQPATIDEVNAFCNSTFKTMCTAGNGSKILVAAGWLSWEGALPHELGHVMGLHHSANTTDLMYPITGGRSKPQSGDINAWHQIWN